VGVLHGTGLQFKIINSSYVTLSDFDHFTVQFAGKFKKKKEEEKGEKSTKRII
jgi:hypothetical protein